MMVDRSAAMVVQLGRYMRGLYTVVSGLNLDVDYFSFFFEKNMAFLALGFRFWVWGVGLERKPGFTYIM